MNIYKTIVSCPRCISIVTSHTTVNTNASMIQSVRFESVGCPSFSEARKRAEQELVSKPLSYLKTYLQRPRYQDLSPCDVVLRKSLYYLELPR